MWGKNLLIKFDYIIEKSTRWDNKNNRNLKVVEKRIQRWISPRKKDDQSKNIFSWDVLFQNCVWLSKLKFTNSQLNCFWTQFWVKVDGVRTHTKIDENENVSYHTPHTNTYTKEIKLTFIFLRHAWFWIPHWTEFLMVFLYWVLFTIGSIISLWYANLFYLKCKTTQIYRLKLVTLNLTLQHTLSLFSTLSASLHCRFA